MEPDGDPPPFWSPSTATILRQQRRRRAPSPILSPVSLILLLPILALFIIFFLLPPFLSTTSQLLRPTYSVKKSWDSFNILLVVFAILCGVFARRNASGDDEQSAPASAAVSAGEAGSSDHVSFSGVAAVVDRNINEDEAVRVARWFDGGGSGANRLRRNSSSYPDLRRQDLLWEAGDIRYRYYDDIDVDLYRQPAGSVELNRRARREEGGVRVIPVDTFEAHSTRPPSPDPPPKAPSPPPPPPPPPVSSKPRQSLHSVPRKQKAEKAPDERRSAPPPNSKPRQLRRRNREAERVRFESSIAAETEIDEIAAPLPEHPPPPPPKVVEVERFTDRRLQRKKSGAKELATAIASLYTDRKRKKKLKRKTISESSSESSPTNVLPYIPPPPPPPPPPAKVFQNLFKKSTKHKRVHSVAATAPPPPPPPPPPSSIFNNIFKTGKSKRFSNISTSSAPPPPPLPPPSSILNTIFNQGNKSRRHKYETRAPPPPPPPPPAQYGRLSRTSPAELQSTPPRRRAQASWKPPLPAKSHSYYDEYPNSGAQSPLVPLPPPPPPPFKMPDFKFVARGDFVRILSAHSSRCSSPERPDLEDVELMSIKSSEGGDSIGGPGPGPFCPSPDVNLKADSFIARLKGEWRMDKMNSFRRERET